MKSLILLAMFILSAQSYANDAKLKDLPKLLKKYVIEQIKDQQEFMEDDMAKVGNNNEIWALSQIDLQSFAFLEFDVLIFEMKIKPYLELRWNKLMPVGYGSYHPLN